MRFPISFLSAVLLLVSTMTVPLRAQTDAAMARGRALTGWLLAGAVDSLMPRLAPEFSSAIGGREGLGALMRRLDEQAGRELEVTEEAAFDEAGFTSYYRVSRFEKMPSVTTRWVWTADGAVRGAQVTPTPTPAATEHLEYRTKTALRLPFDSTWYVAWGGRTPMRNYHVIAPDQRFAYDFIRTRDGRIFAGEGARNEDHFCWGTPVLAPAAGTVVTAVDSIADNERPGVRNTAVPPGNHVVIDHGNGEFSLLAHLRRGSVAVRTGQRVAAGERLGVCGNSGNSTLPHLHYHLQTGPAYREGVGLPAFFRDYRAGAERVDLGEPQRGQTISPMR